MKFRIFTDDVGYQRFSALKDVEARNYKQAIGQMRIAEGVFVIALPHSRKELWPDGKTGRVPPDALSFGGQVVKLHE